MPKRRATVSRRQPRRVTAPQAARPLGWLLSAASVNALAAGPTHNIDAVSGATVTTTGTNVQQVTNNNASGGVAVNVFNHFIVGDGHTVNLQVPTGAKLVNIVRSSQPQVWGVLNAYQDGALGGDVTFASADGFLVGSTGIVNVGKLTLRTPSQTDITNFVSGDKAIADLATGTYSLSSSGLVSIQGKVVARDGVVIDADQLSVGANAVVIAGNAKSASYVNDAAVNTGDLSAPKTLQQNGGTIAIVAQGKSGTAVDIAGQLLADGGITIEAPTIALNSGSKLSTERTGSVATGAVTLTATATDKVGMGQATAATSITLDGSVVATDFSASASSQARASYSEDYGIWAATIALGSVSGLNANWVGANADATVTVGSGASVTASGNLTLASQSRAVADDPAITLNGNSLVGAAVVYGKATSDSTTQVTSGATLSAGGKLSVSAHNENTLSASALTFVATNDNTAVVSVAVGEASSHSKALVETGANLTAGSLAVNAENQTSFYVGATAYGLSGTALGATVAYGNLTTSAMADLGASIGTAAAKVGDVEVLALDRTTEQRVHSSSTVGKSLLFRTLGAAPVAAIGAAQSFVNSAMSRVVPVNAAADLARNADGTMDFRVGAAFTLSEYSHEAVAHVGNNVAGKSAPVIVSSGNLVVGARADVREMRTTSESSVSARTTQGSGTSSDPEVANSASVAINLAVGDTRASAEIGDHTDITAARIGVAAEQWQPLVSTYNRWDSFSDYLDHLTPTAGLGTSLLSGFANAAGEAEENAIAFSFNLQAQTHETKAWVGSRAKLTSTGAAGSWTGSHTLKNLGDFADAAYSFNFAAATSVAAYSQAQTIDIAGNMGALLIGAAVGAGEDGSSLGASMTYVGSQSTTVAGIGSSATVNAGASDLAVKATNDDAHIVVAPTSGMGSGTAFNGILGVFSMANDTRASISSSAKLTAAAIGVEAHQYAGNWAAAGSFAYTDSKAIGVAIAINNSEGTTRARIGDNSDDDALVAGYTAVSTSYSGSAPTAGITTDKLTVHASTDGTSGAIAAAGAATTPKTGEPGYGQQFEDKWAALQGKLTSAFGGSQSTISSQGKSGQQSSGSGDSVAQNPDAGLGISGSLAANITDLDTQAQVSGVTISARTTRSAIDVQALEKTVQIGAAGSAAFIMAAKDPAASSTTAFSGAAAYLLSNNDAEALLSSVTALNTGDVTVQAAQAGQRLGIGLGFSVNTNSASGKNYSVGVSASAAQVNDSASARVENSTLDAQDASRTLDVQAYTRTDIGIGGGSLFGGGKGGIGLAVTYADIANGERDATEALITGSTLTDFSTLKLGATNASRIAAGAASLGGGNDALGFAGSFVINQVGGTHSARLVNSTASGIGTLSLDVRGAVNASLDTTLDGLGSGSENGNFDFSGALVSDFASPGGSFSSTGARVLGVAGLLQYGKSNVGIAYVHNDIEQTHEAAITGSTVTATTVKVNAQDESAAIAVAAGVGVSTGTLSGVGSVAVNEVNNTLAARIGDWNAASASGSITASSISVTAQNRADIVAGAGALAVSKGSSGGLALALNLIGTREHSTTAQIGWTDLYSNGTVDVSATSGTSGDANTLIAFSAGVALSQGGLAFAGAVGLNNVDQTVDAGLRAVNTVKGGTTYRPVSVSVQASDITENQAFGVMGAGSENGIAAAIGVGTNRIDSDVTAQVLGGRSTTLYTQGLTVDASRRNDLYTFDVGVSGASGLSGAASIGTSVTDGHVLAQIASGAKVDATNNVRVSAQADTFHAVGSGAIGLGTGAAAGALAVSTAVDTGVTEALVDNAEVKALGRSGSVAIRSGQLASGPATPDLSTAGDSVDTSALSQSFQDQSLTEGSASVSGLAVNATSTQKMRTVDVAGSGSTGAAAVTINVTTNDFEGRTSARVTGSTINSGVSGEAGADVTVRASDHSFGLGIAAGLAGASQGAGIAGLAMNLQTHDVDARIETSTVKADALALDAAATQTAQAVAAGGAGGGTGAGAASMVVTTQYGDVTAWLKGGTTTVNSAAVNADRQQESDVAAGAVAGAGQVGVGFGLAVSRIGGDTRATIGRDPDDDNATTATTLNAGTVTVDAARSTVINSYAFGAGIGVGGAGIAGMVNVSDQSGDTRAGMYDTVLRAADGSAAATSLGITAQDIYKANQHAAGAGVGLVGIGATFNVALSSAATVAELVGSDVKAGSTGIKAYADREAGMSSVAGGAGKFAGAVSLGFIKFGSGDAGGADGELTDTAAAADAAVNQGYGQQNSQLTSAEQARLNTQSGGLSLSSSVQNSSAAADATTNTGDGTALKVANASLLAARVSGGTLVADSLDVATDGRTHTYTLAGAVQGSLAGLSGGLGITRQYFVNSAVVDGNVQAHAVTVGATERDGSGGAAGEIEAFTAGAGGLVIGVAYSDVLVQNRVVAGVNRAVGNDSGALTVSASDAATVKVGGDNENSPENVSVGVGVIGASVVRAEKNSDVDAWMGKTGYTLDGYGAMTVGASVSGLVRATGFSVSAGVINVTGVSANAEDNSSADARLFGSVDTGSTGTVTVNASARPETYARAYGVQAALGASVGGSFAYATANTSATAAVADNTVFSGSGKVAVNATTGETSAAQQGSYFSADAKAVAASGGLLLGLAGTEVTATNSSKTVAQLGDHVTLPTGDLSLSATGYSGQRADGDAYFGGILAFGSNVATAKSSTSTQVLFGVDPVAGVSRTGELSLSAVGTDRNEAFATGGSGGVVSGGAAEAVVKATDSDADPAVLVQVKDWTSGRNVVGTGGLKLLAEHTTQFYGGADTTAVSVIGGAAANSTTTVDVDAKVKLGTYAAFESQAIDIAAVNAVEQIATPSRSGWDASVNAGAGGGINGYAAGSTVNVTQGSQISLGNNASLDVFALSAHETLGNRLRLDAYSTLNLYDKAQISTGGAIQRADAGSTLTTTANNAITLGNAVTLENEVDTVQLGTYALQNVWATASAKTYGAVGGAGGTAVVNSTVNNTVTLGSSNLITGYGSVSLYAGRSADSITDNAVSLNAVSDVYNWTAASVSTNVKADANAVVNNNIDIGSGASVTSVRNIWLQADEGRVTVSGTGRGHNPYLELLSTETKAGSGTSTTSSTITFQGTATVEAGTRHDQSVTINANGSWTKGSGTQATVYDLPSFSSRDSLQTYITTLTAEKQVTDDYVATLDASAQASYTYSARYQEVVSQLSFLSPLLSELSASTVNAVVVAGITAAGGDVHLAADKVTVKSGTPTITAHGDPTITITNNSAKALIVDTLSIPNDAGGQVLVTGGASNSLPAALKVTEAGGGSGSQITITHNPGVDGADLVVQGDITNLGGKVTVDVERGSMLQTASIYAKELELTVADIYLVNTSGMQTYGFSPLSLSGYVTSSRGWKPASAEEAVMWYVSDRYESEIKSKGITDFNKYFYGTDYATAYGSGATITSHIYLNWGFSNSDECQNNCTTFTFPNHSGGSTRGNGNWGFDNVGDYTGKLTLTASYDTIKNSGFLGTAVTKDALNASLIAVNAGTIDINGSIRAGNFNNWSVDVGASFDTAIATYIAKKGLKAGDTVSITPGQPLYYTEQVYTCAFLNFSCSWKTKTYGIDTGVSLATSGDAGIGLTYDVASSKLSLADVNASGNGMVLLRGKIVSTGADGKILVDDGLGTIKVNNSSTKELVVNDLNAGNQATGVIRITDTNYSNRTDWYVHEAGQQIKHYTTSSSATTYTGATGFTDGWTESGNATTSYQPKTGQWYKWTESTEVKRSYTGRPTNDLATFVPTGDWKFTNQDTPWSVGSGSIVTSCGSCGSNYLTGVFSYGSTTGYDYFPVGWSYSDYYGSTFVDRSWLYYVPTGLKMSVDYYVKADNPIKLQFVGAAQGTVAIGSTTNVALNGTVSNSLGSTSISTSGSLTADAAAVVNSKSLSLTAGGNVGSSAQAFTAITSSISATAGGTVNLDLTAQSSSIALQKISGGSDVTITADKSLLPSGSGTHLAGRNVSVTSSFGGLGDVATSQVVNTAVTGTLTVSTRGDIALRQASGDLTLNTLAAEAGDISITLDNGRLLNGIGSSTRSAEETAYLSQLWQSLNMTGASAGQETVKAFENQVSAKYQQYYLIKQRLSDSSDAGFAISPTYLEAMRSRVALQQGVSSASLSDAAVTAAVKAEYQGLTSFFTAQFGNALPFDPAAAFDSSWRYSLDTNSALYASLTSGAQWKQSQLEVAISEAALAPVTSTYISSRAANLSGDSVTLKTTAGSVGKDAASLAIAISRSNPVLSDTEKAALVSAGPGDLSFATTDTQLLATVKQQDPVKVNATGVFKASSRDALYVESDQAMALGGVQSTQGDVRLSAGGSLTSTTGTGTTITAQGLNLAVSQGSIGTAAAPIRLALSDALRVASAPGDIVVSQGGGSLALGSLGAGGTLSVAAGGDLTNWASNGTGYHLLGDSIELAAGGDLGAADRALRLRLTGGTLKLSGASATVEAQSSGGWSLGDVSLADGLRLDVTGSLQFAGTLNAASAALQASGAVTATAAANWNTSGATTLTGASLSLADARFTASRLALQASAGNLDVGELNAGAGGVTLLATAAIGLHGGVSSAGSLLADGQSLQMAAGAGASVGGDFALTTIGAMDLSFVEAGGDVRLASGALNVSRQLRGASIDVDAAAISFAAGSLLLAAQDVRLGGTQLTMGDGALLTTGGRLAVTTTGLQQLGQLNVGGELALQAGGALSLASSAWAQGRVNVQAGSVSMAAGSSLGTAGALTTTTSGAQSLQTLQAGEALQLQSGGALTLGGATTSGLDASLAAQGAINIAAGSSLQSGGQLSVLGASLSSGSGSLLQSAGDTTLVTSGDQGLAQLLVGGKLDLRAGGSARLAEGGWVQGGAALQAGGLRIDGELASSGAVSLSATQDLALNQWVRASEVTVDAGRLLLASGSGLQASGSLQATATTLDMAAGSVVVGAGAVGLTAQGDLSVAQVSAGAQLAMQAGGTLSLKDSVQAGQSIQLQADRLDIAAGVSVTSGGALSAQASQMTAGAASQLVASTDLQLISGGDVQLALLTAGRHLLLQAAGQARLAETVQVTADADLRAAQLTVAGGLSAGGALRLQGDQAVALTSTLWGNNTTLSGQAVTLSAGSALYGGQSLALTADTLAMAAGSRLDAGTTLAMTTSGAQQLAQLRSGGAMAVQAGAALSLGEFATSNAGLSLRAGGAMTLADATLVQARGALSLQAGSLDAGSGSRLVSGGNLQITSSGHAALARLQSGGQFVLAAGGAASIADTAFMQGLATLQADSLALHGAWTSGNDVQLGATGGVALNAALHARNLGVSAAALDLADGVNAIATGTLSVDAGRVGMGALSQLQSGGNLRLSTTAGQTLASLVAGDGLTLAAGGDIAVRGAGYANGDIAITAGGALGIAPAVTVQAGRALGVQADSLLAGAGSRSIAGGDLTLSTRGDLELAQASSGGALALSAGGALRINELAAAQGAARIAAGELQASGRLAVQGDLEAQVARGLVLAADLQAANVSLTTGSLTLADGVTLTSAGTLAIDSGSIAMGTGSLLDSAAGARLTTLGDQALARLNIAGDLLLQGGSVRLGESAWVQGGAQLLTQALAIDGGLTVGGDLLLSATHGMALNSTLWAANMTLAAGSLGVADGVTLNAAGAMTVNAGSIAMGGGSGLESTAGLQLVTTGDQSLTRLKAGGDLLLQAGGALTLREQAVAGQALNATAGAALDVAPGVLLQSGGAMALQAGSLQAGDASRLASGGDLQLTSGNGITLAQVGVGGSLALQAGGAVALTDSVGVSGSAQLRALQLSVAADLSLLGELRVQADQGVALNRAVQAGSVVVDAGSLAMAPGSRIGADGNLLLQTRGDQVLAQVVAGGGLAVAADGRLSLTGDTLANEITLRAGDALGIAPGVTLGAVGRLDVQARSIDAGASSRLVSGGDLQLSADGDLRLARTDVGGNLTLQARGAVRSLEALTVQGHASLQADSLTVDGGWTSQGDLAVRVAQALTLNSSLQAGNVTINAGTAAMGSGSAMSAGGSLALQTQGGQSLAALNAGGDMTLQAAGTIALTDKVAAAGAIGMTAGGALSVAPGVAVEAGAVMSVQADSLSAAAGSRLASGGDMLLSANGGMLVAQLAVGGSLTLQAGGAARTAEAVAVQGGTSLRADSLAIDGGWASQGDLAVQVTRDLALNSDVQAAKVAIAADAVNLAAGVALRSAGALSVDADAVGMGSGSSMATGGSLALTTQADQTLTGLSVGSNLTLKAGGALSLAPAAAVEAGGVLTLQADSLAAGSGSRLVSGSDMQLDTTGSARIAQLDVGGALRVQAGDAVHTTEAVKVRGDASLRAGRLTVDGGWTSQGGLAVQAVGDVALNSDMRAADVSIDAGALNLATGMALRSADALAVKAGTLAMGAGSSMDAGGALALTTERDQTLATLNAGSGLALQAGGAVALTERVTAGGSVGLKTAGALNVAQAVAIEAGGSLEVRADSLTAGGHSRLASGSGMQLVANGDMLVAQLAASGPLALQAGGAARTTEAVTVRGDASLHADSLTVDAGWTSQGDVAVQVTNGVALNSDLTAAKVSVDAGALNLAAGKALRSAGALAVNAGSLLMGSGSSMDAASSLALTTRLDQTLASLHAGSDLTLQAGRAATLAEQATAGGAVAVTAGGALTVAKGVAVVAGGALNAQAGSLSAGAGSRLVSGADMQLDTQGSALIAQLDAGGALRLQAGGSVRTTEAVAVRGAASLRGDSLTVDGGWASQGGLAVQATRDLALNSGVRAARVAVDAGALNLAAGVALRSGDAVTVDAGTVTMGAGSALSAGGSLALTTQGAQALATLNAGGDLTLQAGGAVALTEQVTAKGALGVTAAGALDIAQGVAVAAGTTFAAKADSLAAQAGSRLASGGDMLLSANGGVLVAQLGVAGGLTLQAGGAVRTAEAVAVQGGTSLRADSLAIDGGWASQGDLTVQVTRDLALNSGVQAAKVAIAADAVNLAGGVALRSAGALTVDAGALGMGAGSSMDAGSSLALTTRLDQTLASLNAGSDLTLQAGRAATLAEQATAGGAVTVTVGGALTVAKGVAVVAGGAFNVQADSLSAGAGSRLASGADMQLDMHGSALIAQLDASGALRLQAGGSVLTTEAVAVQGDTSLRGDSLTVDGGWASQGGLAVQATRDLALNSGVRAARVAVDADALNLAAGVALRSGDAVTVNTGTVTMGVGSTLSAGGSLALTTQGGVDAGTLNLAAGVTLRSGDAVQVTAGTLAMGAGSSMDAGGALALTTQRDQTLATIKAGGDLALQAGGAVRFSEQVAIGGNAQVTAAGDARLDAGRAMSVGGALQLAADAVTMEAGSTLATGAGAAIGVARSAQLQQLRIGKGLAVAAGEGLALQADVQAGGDVALQSGGVTQLADGRGLVAGASFSGQAAEWRMGAGSQLQAEGDLRLQAAGDVQLAALSGHGGLLSVQAGGAVRGRSDATVHLRSAAATRTEIKAGLGIGDPLVVDAPWLSVATDRGDIHLVVERDVYSPLISAENGTVKMTVHGSLGVDQLIGSPDLWIDGRLSAGQMALRGGTLTSRGELQVDGLTLQGGAPLVVQAPRMSLDVDGAGAATTSLSLSGLDGARADNVAVKVTGTQQVEISQLYTRNAQLELPADVALREASVSGALTVKTPVLTLNLDNVSAVARPADAQLLTTQDKFWLQLTGNALYTDALVTRFQAPVALYYHRATEDQLVYQQAFYRMSTEHLSQEVNGNSWRIPMQTQPLLGSGPLLSPASKLVPAVSLENQPSTAGGPAGREAAKDDVEAGEPVASR